MRRDTAWTRNDGGVAHCSSVWLYLACLRGLAHITTILAGQGQDRVATRKAAAKGMPKKRGLWHSAVKTLVNGTEQRWAGMQCRADAAL